MNDLVMPHTKRKPSCKRLRDPDDPMWIVGCIDSYGAITARVCDSYSYMHRKEESKGKRWRWNIWGQEFHATATLDRLSDEEYFLVEDWLERRGHKEPDP